MSERNRRFLLPLLAVLLLAGGLGVHLATREGGSAADRAPAPPDPDAGTEGIAPPPDGTDPGDPVGERPGAAGEGEPGAGTGPDPGAEADPLETETEFTLTVHVRDGRGRPLAARILVNAIWIDDRELGTRETDAEGNLTCFLPEAGDYSVIADRDGSRLRRGFAVTEEAPAAIVELAYPGSSSVSGTVGGEQAGDVRADFLALGEERVRVELVPESGTGGEKGVLYAEVGPDGRYRAGGLAAGAYLVLVRSKWYVGRVELAENEDLVHDIRLSGGRITGRVTDSVTGKPADGVQVVLELRSTDDDRLARLQAAGFGRVTDRLAPDEDGVYAFSNIPPGEYSIFSNGHWYGVVRKVVTVPADGGEVVVDFPLVPGSVVELRILDLAGEDVETPLCATQGILWGFTGSVSGLEAGAHDFLAGGIGFEFQVRKGVVFVPQEATPVEFRLAPAAETRVVFVTDAGEPVEGVRVSVPVDGHDIQALTASFHRRMGGGVFTESAADGHVMILHARAGPCRVVAKKSGFEPFDAAIDLAHDRTEARVVLTPGGTEFVYRVRVNRVAPDSEAERVGLRVGDVILAFHGREIHSAADLAGAVAAAKEEGVAEAKMLVRSGGAEAEVVVAVGVLGVGLEEFEE